MFTNKKTLATVLASTAILTACGSDSNSPIDNGGNGGNGGDLSCKTISIEASSYSTPVYIDLKSATEVGIDDAWHIAVQRSGITLNAGTSSAIVDKRTDLFDADGAPIVQNFEAASADPIAQEQVFSAATSVAAEDYVSTDEIFHYIKSDDFYTAPYQQPSVLNSDNYYIMESNTATSWAKVHASNYDEQTYTLTLDFYVQANESAAFSETPVSWTINTLDHDACFDFDQGIEVSCATTDWDIKAFYLYANHQLTKKLSLNGGASGSEKVRAYGPYKTADFDPASGKPDETNGLSFTYAIDTSGNIFNDYNWYAYDILDAGDHSIWPTFRTYAIDTDNTSTDDEPYKLQILNYYNEQGVSGNLTVRIAPLSATGE